MADKTQEVGCAGARAGWRAAHDDRTGFEYLRAPGMLGGRVVWHRETKTWAAELVNMPPADAGVRTPLVSACDFATPLAAQEWVEFCWHAVNAQYPNN